MLLNYDYIYSSIISSGGGLLYMTKENVSLENVELRLGETFDKWQVYTVVYHSLQYLLCLGLTPSGGWKQYRFVFMPLAELI